MHLLNTSIQNINYLMLMYASATGIFSPCNIDWTYPTQKQVGKFFDVKIYTTYIQSLTSSHITHITSSNSSPLKF